MIDILIIILKILGLIGWTMFIMWFVGTIMLKIKKLDGDFLCGLGSHDWRDGPGYPCVKCGTPDDFPYDENA